MTLPTLLWTVAGLATGLWHAAMLWRKARRPDRAGVGAALRLPAVAGVLVAAAMFRALPWAAGGWAGGLAAGGLLFLIRR